jgi:hypothetical protein
LGNGVTNAEVPDAISGEEMGMGVDICWVIYQNNLSGVRISKMVLLVPVRKS